jgi:hypothetical protein
MGHSEGGKQHMVVQGAERPITVSKMLRKDYKYLGKLGIL